MLWDLKAVHHHLGSNYLRRLNCQFLDLFMGIQLLSTAKENLLEQINCIPAKVQLSTTVTVLLTEVLIPKLLTSCYRNSIQLYDCSPRKP